MKDHTLKSTRIRQNQARSMVLAVMLALGAGGLLTACDQDGVDDTGGVDEGTSGLDDSGGFEDGAQEGFDQPD